MYLPKHFEEPSTDILHALMDAVPLATLVTVGDDGLCADHVPLLLSPDPGPYGSLRGHVARANPLWRRAGTEVLAIFCGPDAYISPSWYATKSETGKVVPTWNYVVAHASGTLTVYDDPNWLRAFLSALTERHERTMPAPWSIDDAPAAYIDAQLKAIVGIEIPIARLIGKWKVSQNQPERNRQGVADGLRACGRDALAELVRKRA
jgi:transcriptional regulator